MSDVFLCEVSKMRRVIGYMNHSMVNQPKDMGQRLRLACRSDIKFLHNRVHGPRVMTEWTWMHASV